MSLLYIFLFLMSMTIPQLVLEAHAIINTNSYGIVISQGCRTMLQNNITTTCPTYEEINVLFPDTSNQYILGEFGYKDGIYQRLHSGFTLEKGICNFQQCDNLVILDPPVVLWNKLNIIEIRPSLDDYLFRGKTQSYNATEHSITLGHGRYIDSCRYAYIDSNLWEFLAGDSMNFISHQCDPDYTNYDSTKTTYLTKIEHDISTSYKWKLEQWIKQAVADCKTRICIPK